MRQNFNTNTNRNNTTDKIRTTKEKATTDEELLMELGENKKEQPPIKVVESEAASRQQEKQINKKPQAPQDFFHSKEFEKKQVKMHQNPQQQQQQHQVTNSQQQQPQQVAVDGPLKRKAPGSSSPRKARNKNSEKKATKQQQDSELEGLDAQIDQQDSELGGRLGAEISAANSPTTISENSTVPSTDNKEASQSENICAACLKPIKERYLLMALDKQWHEDCLKCACCDCRLGEVGSSLFTHSDKILCRRDFLRIFGQHGFCAACKKSIPPYEMVMRANQNAYHMDCFACQQCQYRFCVGDRFHLTEAHRIVCILCHAEQQQPTNPPHLNHNQHHHLQNQTYHLRPAGSSQGVEGATPASSSEATPFVGSGQFSENSPPPLQPQTLQNQLNISNISASGCESSESSNQNSIRFASDEQQAKAQQSQPQAQSQQQQQPAQAMKQQQACAM